LKSESFFYLNFLGSCFINPNITHDYSNGNYLNHLISMHYIIFSLKDNVNVIKVIKLIIVFESLQQ